MRYAKTEKGGGNLVKIPSVVKKIWNIFTTVTVILVVVFAIMLVGVRFIGVQVFSVISGSMEPEYPVGSLIYVKEAEFNEVKKGDVITYVLPNGTPSTHRVVSVDEENRQFYTKGDANKIADSSPVSEKNLLGKPVFKIPILGFVAYYIQRPPGMYVAIAIGALMVIAVFLPDIFKSDGKKNTKAPDNGKANQG